MAIRVIPVNQHAVLLPPDEATNRMKHTDWPAVLKNVTSRWANLPEPTRFYLPELQLKLQSREYFKEWHLAVLSELEAFGVQDLIYRILPRLQQDHLHGLKWYTLSVKVRAWLARGMDPKLLRSFEAAEPKVRFADEFVASLKYYMLPKHPIAYGQQVTALFTMFPSGKNDTKRFLRDYVYETDGMRGGEMHLSAQMALRHLVTTIGSVNAAVKNALLELIMEERGAIGWLQFHDIAAKLYCSV